MDSKQIARLMTASLFVTSSLGKKSMEKNLHHILETKAISVKTKLDLIRYGHVVDEVILQQTSDFRAQHKLDSDISIMLKVSQGVSQVIISREVPHAHPLVNVVGDLSSDPVLRQLEISANVCSALAIAGFPPSPAMREKLHNFTLALLAEVESSNK